MVIDKQKLFAFGAIAILTALLVLSNKKPETETPEVQKTEVEEVEEVVKNFGKRFHLVSLLADKATLKSAIAGHYSPYVAPELISKWQKDTSLAPGRAVSSPWPDRIEIDTTTKNADGSYKVEGRVVEITTSSENDGFASEYPVVLELKKDARGKWMITKFTKVVEEAPKTN